MEFQDVAEMYKGNKTDMHDIVLSALIAKEEGAVLDLYGIHKDGAITLTSIEEEDEERLKTEDKYDFLRDPDTCWVPAADNLPTVHRSYIPDDMFVMTDKDKHLLNNSYSRGLLEMDGEGLAYYSVVAATGDEVKVNNEYYTSARPLRRNGTYPIDDGFHLVGGVATEEEIRAALEIMEHVKVSRLTSFGLYTIKIRLGSDSRLKALVTDVFTLREYDGSKSRHYKGKKYYNFQADLPTQSKTFFSTVDA